MKLPAQRSRPFASRQKATIQQGAATLIMTVILLLAVGLMVLYTNRAAIMEQRLSANEIRTKQAFAAASAGLDQALAYMRKGGIDQDKNGVPDVITPNTLTSSSGTPSYYQALYCDPLDIPYTTCPATHGTALSCTLPPAALPQPVVPMDLSRVGIISCGWSDDDSSVQRIVQLAGFSPSLGGSISTPVTSRGTANLLTGGASILNYFNDLTVWSGGALLGQSNTGKTFIRDEVSNPIASLSDPYRNVGNSPGCNNPPTGYQCSTQGANLGHDTVSNDTKLSSLSSDGFFQYFFGQTPVAYRDSTATWVVDPGSVLATSNSTSLNSIVNMQDNAIWVEGNASLPGNIGTQDHPVVLIVNGDFDMSANSVINGLVYVTGNITGNGSPTIYGAIVNAGSANVTGNLKVVFDPKVLGAASNLGQAARLQGSWRDW
ncbi:pilus assembly PilX family protein [Cupriavidus lacunae]|nr:pilus assembly PilX N-terminal domain-containing protein [Cupriavidus lacunae]